LNRQEAEEAEPQEVEAAEEAVAIKILEIRK
jgi:hypothetical protein